MYSLTGVVVILGINLILAFWELLFAPVLFKMKLPFSKDSLTEVCFFYLILLVMPCFG